MEVPFVVQWLMNPARIHEDVDLILGLAQWVKDPTLLWLWCRLAAVALTPPLAWEFPYAMGVALKSKKKKRFHLLIFHLLQKVFRTSLLLPLDQVPIYMYL